MRYLFALLAIALGLAACDDSSTTAPVADAIPNGSDAPIVSIRIISGTITIPSNNPKFIVSWKHSGKNVNGSVQLYHFGATTADAPLPLKYSSTAQGIFPKAAGIDSTIFSLSTCDGYKKIRISVDVYNDDKSIANAKRGIAIDSVYCN